MQSHKASRDLPDSLNAPVFAAMLRPHRSLGPQQFRTLMRLSCLAAIAISLPFVALGLWPIAGFLTLDLLGLYVALRVNFRSGRSFEEVVLTPIELMFRQVSHRGASREWRFNPLWTKLNRDGDPEYGLQALRLVSRGEQVVIARELSPAERESFAEALGQALARVKRGF